MRCGGAVEPQRLALPDLRFCVAMRRCVDALLGEVVTDEGAEVMVASHNQARNLALQAGLPPRLM